MLYAPLYRTMHYLDNSYKEIHMKKIIALGFVLFTSVAFAAMDSGNGSGSGSNDGKADVAGNGSGEGEANFSMSFTGRGKTKGDFIGQAENGMNNRAYGYENPYYSFPAEDK